MTAVGTALLDGCVLVPASLRDTLLRLAEPPALYQPRWSDEIITEMKRALEAQIGLSPAKTAYLERELRRHFAECWVGGFEPLVRKMTNDAKDRHVLAAAVRARGRPKPADPEGLEVEWRRYSFNCHAALLPWGIQTTCFCVFCRYCYFSVADRWPAFPAP